MVIIKYFAVLTGLVAAQLCAQSVAGVVISTKGIARVGGVTAEPGTLLRAGDSVWIGKSSELQWMDPSGGISIVKKSQIATSASAVPAILTRAFEQAVRTADWFNTARHARVPSIRASGDHVTLIYPRNSAMYKKPSHLEWASVVDGPFECAVRCYEEEIYYDEKSEGLKISTAEMEFKPQSQFFWYAKPEGGDLAALPPAVWFRILSAEERSIVDTELGLLRQTLNGDTLNVAFQLLKCNILMHFDLNHDAITVLEEVLRSHPMNSVAHIYRARLAERMELPDQMVKSLQMVERLRQ